MTKIHRARRKLEDGSYFTEQMELLIAQSEEMTGRLMKLSALMYLCDYRPRRRLKSSNTFIDNCVAKATRKDSRRRKLSQHLK